MEQKVTDFALDNGIRRIMFFSRFFLYSLPQSVHFFRYLFISSCENFAVREIILINAFKLPVVGFSRESYSLPAVKIDS